MPAEGCNCAKTWFITAETQRTQRKISPQQKIDLQTTRSRRHRRLDVYRKAAKGHKGMIFDTNLGGLCGLVVKILVFLSVSSVSLADVIKGVDGAESALW